MWVRDYRPNAICKWTKGVIKLVDGPLNHSIVLDNGHSRRVHEDHIIDCPELPTPNSTTTTASRSPEELRDMVVQNVPQDGNHFPSSPVTPSTTCPADTASSETVPTPRQLEMVQGDSQHLTPGSTYSRSSPSLVSSVTGILVREKLFQGNKIFSENFGAWNIFSENFVPPLKNLFHSLIEPFQGRSCIL